MTSNQRSQLLIPMFGISFLKLAFLKLDEVAFKDFKPPEIENSRSFGRSFPDVWSAIIEVLSENQLPFELVDKASGLLTTRAIPDPLGDTMVCATTFDEANKVSFNIFAKQNPDSTKVRINASFFALRDDAPINCFSNGTLEAWLFASIAVALGES